MPSVPPEWPIIRTVAVGTLLIGVLVFPATTAQSLNEEACSRSFEMDGPRLYLPAAENASVTGHHDWPANTNATVVLRFTDDGSTHVLRNDSVTVRDDRWVATFDLSTVDEGRTFVARLERDGRVVDTVDGEVGTASASVTFENQTASESQANLTIRRVHLDLGGFVAVHNNSSLGFIAGVSEYLPPGTHENVTVEMDASMAGPTRLVAVAHLDSDCDETFERVVRDEDGPYAEYGPSSGTGADAATVHVSAPTPSPSPNATPTSSPTPVSSEPDVPTISPTETTTSAPGAEIYVTLGATIGGILILWRTR